MGTTTCPKCYATDIPLNAYFCPQCGAQLRIKPSSTSTFTQISLYVGSLLLPPLGFWWAYKYYRIPDGKGKKIALICAIITVVSLALSFIFFKSFSNSVSQQINSQINNTNLGF